MIEAPVTHHDNYLIFADVNINNSRKVNFNIGFVYLILLWHMRNTVSWACLQTGLKFQRCAI